jgi:hypothetical protein
LDDVEVTETLRRIIGDDKAQDHLHRILAINKSSRDEKANLAEHVQKVFDILIDSFPHCALDKLEEVSTLLKQGDMEKFLKLSEPHDNAALAHCMLDYCVRVKGLFVKPKADDGDDGEAAEEAEATPVCFIEDLQRDCSLMQWAGIGFGQQEVYCLQKAL